MARILNVRLLNFHSNERSIKFYFTLRLTYYIIYCSKHCFILLSVCTMAGLPNLPGFTFKDPTVARFHLCQTFDFKNGYCRPKQDYTGIGKKQLEAHSVKYIEKKDPVLYDPSLTYGRTRSPALPQFLPHFALYDQKSLTFKAFFKQSVTESPLEYYRVRHVNIVYFLEDDTITVIEPKTPNSGLDQGRLVRRGRILKTADGTCWHWKDLGVGKDIAINGIVYHLVDCDTFTREYLASQGLVMGDVETLPPDPYTLERAMKVPSTLTSKTPPADNKLRRFLEYDGKVLKFKALWDDRDAEYGNITKYELLYFLSEDTICVKEIHERNNGRDPYPQLLRKMKLPKIYTDRPVTFPSIYLELSDAEVSEYYQPKDLIVGETVFVLGRKLLLYDCDNFTRNYFKMALCITQPPAINIEKQKPPEPEKKMPPHNGIGSLEDSLQNTITFLPKPPRKDVLRQILNANKYLRYEMVMDAIHPEDSIRKFMLLYSLADGTCKIHEPRIKNSGILGGKYLRNTLLVKPGSDPLNPVYYSPADFYIGAVVVVFEQRFNITGADLYVYRYMQANPAKFPCDVIENMRNYMFNKGYLADELEEHTQANLEVGKKSDRAAIGTEIEIPKTEMEKCLETMNIGGENYDPVRDKQIKARILKEYEDSLMPTYRVPAHGIKPITKVCAYEPHVGDVPTHLCKEEPEDSEGKFTSYTVKHVDTPEETTAKYYANILKKHHDVCKYGKPVECEISPDDRIATKPQVRAQPIMVSPAEYPPGACKPKSVRFEGVPDRCAVDRHDLCNLKTGNIQCDCTNYQKDCQ